MIVNARKISEFLFMVEIEEWFSACDKGERKNLADKWKMLCWKKVVVWPFWVPFNGAGLSEVVHHCCGRERIWCCVATEAIRRLSGSRDNEIGQVGLFQWVIFGVVWATNKAWSFSMWVECKNCLAWSSWMRIVITGIIGALNNVLAHVVVLVDVMDVVGTLQHLLIRGIRWTMSETLLAMHTFVL
jgi:hypothetical protein